MSDTESESELQELLSVPGVYKEIEVPRASINNKPLINNILRQISKSFPWIERLDVVTVPAPPPKDTDLENDFAKVDPNDDFKREALFYRVAQAAVLEAIPKLHELGIPTKRPNDYFAEMIKSDSHMAKVREHIVVSKKRLEMRERARQLREQRKFGKQQQKEILEARRLEKKKHMQTLKAAKKRLGGKEQAQLLEEFLRSDSKQSKGKPSRGGNEATLDRKYFRPAEYAKRRKINHRRAYKNQKYGFGGQKKRSKRNDAQSIRTTAKDEVSVLTHTASAERIKRLGRLMQKTRRRNAQRQRKRASANKI
ncbi:putative rRNA-processing protein EBP2 [Echinococcus granulosus]|uniref:Putative rRNA-processing protein EBP2 n=1 Tax=Echinococcus granulosus TaxID=6210 RepID=U6JIB2_ECHGR|nr:putative rRNA-processing protein EBP2 [Echinococcus granulosus]EUB56392.1 putative rRNA-processing protein EBP2 [Echinococcus granulosus]KAH9278999.1 putative rRNA-processing protein EBP2 [Echinococcus granulosus]CDS23807.1 rRNA processing protein EBP2 [Echinococcus granulosus]